LVFIDHPDLVHIEDASGFTLTRIFAQSSMPCDCKTVTSSKEEPLVEAGPGVFYRIGAITQSLKRRGKAGVGVLPSLASLRQCSARGEDFPKLSPK
jgi:hypothetical protein